MERKDWEDLSLDEEAALDAIEEVLLNQIRKLQEEDATHDKVQIVNPHRMTELKNTLKKLGVALKPMFPDVRVSTSVQPLSKAGCISISFPDVADINNVAAFCDALDAADRAEIGIAFGKVYIDITFYDLIQTEYLD